MNLYKILLNSILSRFSMSRFNKRQLLKAQFGKESKLVRSNSLIVLHTFERLS